MVVLKLYIVLGLLSIFANVTNYHIQRQVEMFACHLLCCHWEARTEG